MAYQPQQQQHHPQDYAYDYNRVPSAKHRPRDEDGPMHPPPFAPYPDQRAHERDSPAGDDSDSGQPPPVPRASLFPTLIILLLDDTLSFQTLNADGTPKRPMNAFLLYAVNITVSPISSCPNAMANRKSAARKSLPATPQCGRATYQKCSARSGPA